MKAARIAFSVVLTAALLMTTGVTSSAYAGSHPLKRRVSPKKVYTKLPDKADVNRVVFKLREGSDRAQLIDGQFVRSGGQWDRLNEILSADAKVESVNRRVMLKVSKLDEMRAEGSRRIGWQLPDMSLYYEAHLKGDLSEPERLDMINRFNALEIVEISYFVPRAELPSVSADAASGTPDWEYMQYYLHPAPIGIDAHYGWSFPGGRGENILTIDIEGNWTETHEDLRGGTTTFHIAGVRSDDDGALGHGTSVIGIIAADSNSLGTTGVSYNVDLGTVAADYEWPYLANAILTASDYADEGDIILIEFQMWGPAETTVVAMEYLQENFDAILTASALGRIVVEPAANGNADYDDVDYIDSLFYPEYRFSGAIMVGASYANHTPAPFTNYGKRLDVHGFGCWDIHTHGWGYLYGDNPDNYYTGYFSGTSSASPIVVGACAILQGIHKEHTDTTLDHVGMRHLLTTYSTPQADHDKRIGPMPNLAGSCDAITGFIRPSPPSLVFPEDNAYFDAPAQPTLDWNDITGVDSYDAMIDNNQDFSSPVGQEHGVAASEWTTPALNQGMYFWRVRSNNANGFGSWSEARVIMVDIQPQVPVQYWPADADRVHNAKNFPVKWNRIEGVTEYLVEVDWSMNLDGSYRKQTYSQPCEDDTCWAGFNLTPATYYWRVRAVGEDWPWSELMSFQLYGYPPANEPKGPRNKSEAPTGPEEFVLTGNYPNPFNPTTEIRFSLPHACHARLDIFNIMGQKVGTLIDGNLNAGQHTVTWDGSRAASGIYLYRLTEGDTSVSKKMLMLK